MHVTHYSKLGGRGGEELLLALGLSQRRSGTDRAMERQGGQDSPPPDRAGRPYFVAVFMHRCVLITELALCPAQHVGTTAALDQLLVRVDARR